jgi:hypothetical protein
MLAEFHAQDTGQPASSAKTAPAKAARPSVPPCPSGCRMIARRGQPTGAVPLAGSVRRCERMLVETTTDVRSELSDRIDTHR